MEATVPARSTYEHAVALLDQAAEMISNWKNHDENTRQELKLHLEGIEQAIGLNNAAIQAREDLKRGRSQAQKS